ncbi:MAG: tetratricopeptide repeat protein [Desulfobacteraceae bacterium]|jgi:tetratricopeptide (TPR) repeat protein
MRKQPPQLYHNRESTRHFLYSKAEAEGPQKKRIYIPARIQKAIQSVYPGLLSGHAFIDHTEQQLSSTANFAWLVFQIDAKARSHKKNPKPDPVDAHQKVATFFDDFCKKHKGSWGLINSGLFGAFFEDKNASQCLKLVRNFQDKLIKQTGIPVSAGIAEYPTLSYQPAEILTNALKALDHATFFGPGSKAIFDAVSLNISGDRLFDKGDIKGSVSEFRLALKLDPSNINVHNSLGVCYGLMGDYEKAKKEFKIALKLKPKAVMPWYNFGFTNMLAGDHRKALDLFLKANTIDPNVFEVAFQTGRLLMEIDQPESGKKFLEHAAELEPKSGAVFRYLGECYTAIGDVEAAISAYTKAIKYNPSDAASLSALGYLFDEREENQEIALMFCQESVRLSPENGLFRYRLGQLYLKENRLTDALKQFKKAEFLGQDTSALIRQIKKQLPAKAS